MFICGRRSFGDEDKDRNGSYILTPKRWKKSKGSSKRNPYAERGLDKFYRLLADVDEEKQKIYSKIGVEDVSFVRFVYSDSFKHVRPIIVRAKNNNSPNVSVSSSQDEEIGDQREEKMKICERWNGRFRVESLSGSSYYCFSVMMVLVLVLLFLAINGRSMAILCTTVTWYLVRGILRKAMIDIGN